MTAETGAATRSEEVALKTGTIKKVMMWLLIAFVVVNIWQGPEVAADYTSDFLGNIGGFVSDLIDRTARFLTNLGGEKSTAT